MEPDIVWSQIWASNHFLSLCSLQQWPCVWLSRATLRAVRLKLSRWHTQTFLTCCIHAWITILTTGTSARMRHSVAFHNVILGDWQAPDPVPVGLAFFLMTALQCNKKAGDPANMPCQCQGLSTECTGAANKVWDDLGAGSTSGTMGFVQVLLPNI